MLAAALVAISGVNAQPARRPACVDGKASMIVGTKSSTVCVMCPTNFACAQDIVSDCPGAKLGSSTCAAAAFIEEEHDSFEFASGASCPDSKVMVTIGSNKVEICLPCPSNFYCTANTIEACPNGGTSPEGSSKVQQCRGGAAAPSAPSAAAPGSPAATAARFLEVDAEAEEDVESGEVCPDGTISLDPNQPACVPCMSDYFCAGGQATACPDNGKTSGPGAKSASECSAQDSGKDNSGNSDGQEDQAKPSRRNAGF
jgi:hypothetical protein